MTDRWSKIDPELEDQIRIAEAHVKGDPNDRWARAELAELQEQVAPPKPDELETYGKVKDFDWPRLSLVLRQFGLELTIDQLEQVAEAASDDSSEEFYLWLDSQERQEPAKVEIVYDEGPEPDLEP